MQRPKFYNSIRFQIMVSVIIVSFTVMSISFLVFRDYYEKATQDPLEKYAINLNETLEDALELVMLQKENKIAGMKHVVETVAHRENGIIKKASILHGEGVVIASSLKEEIGKEISMRNPACVPCHQSEKTDKWETIAYYIDDKKIMRSINPISRPSCEQSEECHSSRKAGMLILDFPVQSFSNTIFMDLKYILFIFGGAAVILVSLFYLLMNKVIFSKLTRIVEIAQLVGRGDISQRIQAMGDNEISLLANSFNDVIQSLEESTQECTISKDNLAHLINSVEDSIFVVDRQYRIVMANKAAVASKNISMEEAIGLPCSQVSYYHTGKLDDVRPNNHCPTAETFETGKLTKRHQTCLDENGEIRHIEIYSSPLSRDEKGNVTQVVEVARDITERKYLEAQLDYSEKLASLGRMAAGIAHEINNPIAAIIASVEGLQKQSKDVEFKVEKALVDLPQYLETIEKSAYRCEEITRKLLMFSRQTETTFEWVNPNELIEDAIHFAEYEAARTRKNIKLNLDQEIPRIRGDKSQLSQVFLNLIHNALDAIDAAGEVKITTRRATNAIEIIFEDTGCGIAKENLQKIFEPFFTTKRGEGTGLGLSISKSIIRKHGGDIKILRSEIGIGTTFCIVLPTHPWMKEGDGYEE